jgi:hypothetical protein
LSQSQNTDIAIIIIIIIIINSVIFQLTSKSLLKCRLLLWGGGRIIELDTRPFRSRGARDDVAL